MRWLVRMALNRLRTRAWKQNSAVALLIPRLVDYGRLSLVPQRRDMAKVSPFAAAEV
jgi:hypothetical protein